MVNGLVHAFPADSMLKTSTPDQLWAADTHRPCRARVHDWKAPASPGRVERVHVYMGAAGCGAASALGTWKWLCLGMPLPG